MIGYILMALGAYLVTDDLIKARRAKNAKLLENGNVRSSGNRDSKPGANGKKSDRDGRVKPFPVENSIPLKNGNKGGKNDISKKPIQQVGIDKAGSGAGDNSNRQPDAASSGNQTEGVTEVPVETGIHKGGSNESNLENGISNDGDNVGPELSGVDESNRTKTD